MPYNPQIHHRRSIRLRQYDYTQSGAYFVTICCYQKNCLFGEIKGGIMYLNATGDAVQQVWSNLPNNFPKIALDDFVIMPNHLHGIICLIDSPDLMTTNTNITPVNPMPNGTKKGSLGAIVQNFKSISTRRVNNITRNSGTIWQRNYYETIIRDDRAYENIKRYINENPLKWEEDPENPTPRPPTPR
jgi:REP element-mobilizing transposase RayT